MKYDYSGNKLATGGSDGKIKIFEGISNSMINISEQKRHEHSVWDIAWSHPRFGLHWASVGFDRKIYIWKEHSQKIWKKNFSYTMHSNSVNTCEFSPNEYGLILLCGSSDGDISLHKLINDTWQSQLLFAHTSGVNCVSWAPALDAISFQNEDNEINWCNDKNEEEKKVIPSQTLQPMRFATGGCDSLIKIWIKTENESNDESLSTLINPLKVNNWYTINNYSSDFPYKFNWIKLKGHQDWVRDVCWLKYVGCCSDTIASCSEDETVKIWRKVGNEWKYHEINKIFGYPTWKAEWSHCGTFLSVTSGDNSIYFFQENMNGVWEETSKILQTEEIQ